MKTTKIFMAGNSQAIRIPKKYRFNTDKVFINKIGKAIILTAKKDLAKEYQNGTKTLWEENFLRNGIPESMPSYREKL